MEISVRTRAGSKVHTGSVVVDWSSSAKWGKDESGTIATTTASAATTTAINGDGDIKVTRKRRGRMPGQDPAEVLRRLPVMAKKTTVVVVRDDDPASTAISALRPRLLTTTLSPPLDIPVAGLDVYIDPEYIEHDRRKRYRAQDFAVALKNEHDHGPQKMMCYFHPVLHAAIVDMVKCGEFPLRSENALVNTLVLDGMRKLHYIRQRLETGDEKACEPNWIAILESISATTFQFEQIMSFEQEIDRADLLVRRLSKKGEFGERQAAKYVVGIRNKAKKMASAEWGQWFLEQIDGRWGQLLEKWKREVRVVRGEVQNAGNGK